MLTIKQITKEERPRERLIRYGANSLSNEELLSILLKSGTISQNVKELSHNLINEINGVNNLNKVSYQKLTSIKGIGSAKACTILASIELVKRVNTKSITNIVLDNPKIIYEYYKQHLCDLKQEHFYCIYLDNRKKYISERLLFIGTNNRSIVHPREIFKEAYLINASSIICIHNHPSDSLIPSGEDINITKRLKEISVLFGINLVDHIIVAESGYYSFFENGDL